MSLDALIMLVGALVALMPFLGFTVDTQMLIFFVLGIVVIGLGIAVRRRGERPQQVRARKGEFVESVPVNFVSHDTQTFNEKHSHDDAHTVA